jgi:hypothetical protein
MIRLGASALFASFALLAGCSGDGDSAGRRSETRPREDPGAVERAPAGRDAGPVHVHALGVNPADGRLFVATHTGLFREPRPGAEPKRIADRYQDTMGFTVVGADRFLASGHPDPREGLPPFLGLIESTDAGRSWTPVSLQGDMDFHLIEAAGSRIYGYGSDWDTRAERLLVSDDRGRSWQPRRSPEPLLDLAVDPGRADRAIAAGRRALHITLDAGRSWRDLRGRPGLLAWTKGGLYSVDSEGVVRLARHDLGRAETVGRVGGAPVAFDATSSRELYVGLHDGTIKRSNDGGRSWHVGLPRRRSEADRDRPAGDDTGRPRQSRPSQAASEAFRTRCEELRDLVCGRDGAARAK